MAVLDVQRRSQQIGRIRIGREGQDRQRRHAPEQARQPLDSPPPASPTADAIAELFGGTVRDWEGQFEVITDRSEIGVTVPPRDAVISQWYEMWTARRLSAAL